MAKKTLKQQIDELTEQGYEVEIDHLRRYETPLDASPSPRGGMTRAHILEDGYCVVYGEAHCSKEDNYNRRRGAQIALGRAVKELNS